ncbi:MAG: CDP-glycerol glycerophosphotransferase family protein [Chloroflexi bacterium]|nr:CDP-glycerol glycerophosphotransferase family protein [Chloroflexota bacterium]
MEKTKTIVIAAPSGTEAKNVFRTEVLDILKTSNLRVIVLTPTADEDYFAKELADGNVILGRLHHPGTLASLYRAFHFDLFMNPDFTKTVKWEAEWHRRRKPLKNLPGILMTALCKYKPLKRLFQRLGLAIVPGKLYDRLFKKYKPSLVVVAYRLNPYDPYIFPLLKNAKRAKIPIICFVPSWDNVSAKGELAVHMDKLIVWNEINKREAIALHGYSPDEIYVSGPTQFDSYFIRKGFSAREEFFRETGADPKRRLLTYTTAGIQTIETDAEILDILKGFVDENKFVFPCQLLVRIHPVSREKYEHLRGCKNIIVEEPGRFSKTQVHYWDPSVRDMLHLGNLMMHSDVVINVASTITIEASIFDTPVVNVAFDGYKKKPYWDSVTRYYNEYPHYINIVRTGGVRIATTKDELLTAINAYLKNPELDRAGRRRIVEEQCRYTDGKSGERVASYILDFLNGRG